MERTYLDEILVARRRRLQEERAHVPLARYQEAVEARPPGRDFAAALQGDGLRVIAELKRASPSRGLLCLRYRRREIAQAYESAGAAALSVLTEDQYFLGSLSDVAQVREAVRLPVLRKDFIVDPYQVYESAAAGADAILLIAAALSDKDLRGLLDLSGRLKLAALVEVHTKDDLSRALDLGAKIIGVNNRDLKTMHVDLGTSLRLRSRIPADCSAVSESGITTTEDLRELAAAGFHAVLIGTRLITMPDPGRALAELVAGLNTTPSP